MSDGLEFCYAVIKVIMPLSLDRIHAKEVVVGVLGLGYVGFPLSLVFAEAGVKVIGFDIDESKIQSIAAGKSYFQHISSEKLQKSLHKGLFWATSDFKQAAACDALIICVPTPEYALET